MPNAARHRRQLPVIFPGSLCLTAAVFCDDWPRTEGLSGVACADIPRSPCSAWSRGLAESLTVEALALVCTSDLTMFRTRAASHLICSSTYVNALLHSVLPGVRVTSSSPGKLFPDLDKACARSLGPSSSSTDIAIGHHAQICARTSWPFRVGAGGNLLKCKQPRACDRQVVQRQVWQTPPLMSGTERAVVVMSFLLRLAGLRWLEERRKSRCAQLVRHS